MAHHRQEVFLGKGIEGEPEAEAVGQRDLVLHRFVGVEFAVHHLPVLVVALLLRDQVAAVGRGIEQHIVRRPLQGAIEHALEHPVVALARLEREVVAEQHEALRQPGKQLHHAGQVGQVVTFHLHQAQPFPGMSGEQRPDQRRLARAPRAPQQGMVGRQAVDELAGVARQGVPLRVHADQIVEIQVQAHLQRLQEAAAPVAVPARRQATFPVDDRALRRQQRLEAGQHRVGAFEEVEQSGIHVPTPCNKAQPDGRKVG